VRKLMSFSELYEKHGYDGDCCRDKIEA
jgi:hypothetical protein